MYIAEGTRFYLIVFDHALILLRLPRETIGVGYAGACCPGESEVS